MKRWFYGFLKWILIGPIVRLLCRFEVSGIKNLPKGGRYVIASNHLSGLDPILLQVRLPVQIAYVAKIELFRLPIMGRMMVWSDQVPLDREKAKARDFGVLKTLAKEAKDRLDRGMALGLFPEGTRSRDGRLHRFQTGAVDIATMARKPIIPVGIAHSWSWRKLGLRVRIVIGEPIENTGRKDRDLAKDLQQRIAALSGQEISQSESAR